MSEEIVESPDAVIERDFNGLLAVKPSLVANTVPVNKAEAKQAFLQGSDSKPPADFGNLAGNNLDVIDQIDAAGEQLLKDASVLQPKFVKEYRAYVEWAKKDTMLGYLMDAYSKATDPTEKERIKIEFMRINIEVFGEPDRNDYQSALHDKVAGIEGKNLTGRAAEIQRELGELTADIPASDTVRYQPSAEAMEWYKGAIESLCEPMIACIPNDKEVFSGNDVEAIFRDILENVFEDSASEWRVVREAAASVNVRTKDKTIVVPVDYKDITRKKMTELIGHELGVHLLRSVMGAETDMPLLAIGLANYYDSEEGLGKAAEHALNGKYVEAGLDHLITAGLVHHSGRNFREAYEIKWRIRALESIKEGDVTNEQVGAAQSAAYDGTMRMLRGTGELPWFKDLAYYYGPVAAWKHIERIMGDEMMLTFMMLGKTNQQTPDHMRLQLETRSKD